MKSIAGKKGAALVWAVIVVSVLFIIVAGILMLCMSYYNRTLSEYTRENAVLAARSAIDYIEYDVINNSLSEYRHPGTTPVVFEFEDGERCLLYLLRNYSIAKSSETLNIHAVCEYQGGTVYLGALLLCKTDLETGEETWTFDGYLDS